MNMLDMYTREKTNKIHIDKMRRDKRHHDLIRRMNSTRTAAVLRKIRLMLIFAALVILLGAFLIPPK